ncbi:V-type ATP synthase subunit D [bacterium]|nr:V-type ATP synthase subunit D [bacterium]
MKLKINPTRMELLKLKKRIKLARRGHKLLRDKEEQLLIEFRKLVGVVKEKRKEVEEALYNFYVDILTLRGITEEKRWQLLLSNPFLKSEFITETKKVLNIPVSEIHLKIEKLAPDYFSPPFYVYLLQRGKEIIEKILDLYTLENKLISFSEEIERTRRRVNALEHVLIPNLEETIKFITFKLDEYERSSLVKLKHLQMIKS